MTDSALRLGWRQTFSAFHKVRGTVPSLEHRRGTSKCAGIFSHAGTDTVTRSRTSAVLQQAIWRHKGSVVCCALLPFNYLSEALSGLSKISSRLN